MDRRRLLVALQIIVALAASVYVVWLIDWSEAVAVMAAADPRWFLLAFMLSLIAFIPAALRWVGLLRGMGVGYRLVSGYLAYLTGTFYSLAMPGVIGGDAARIWLCRRETGARLWLIAASVLTERALGVAALLVVLSIGLGLFPAASRVWVTEAAPFLAVSVLLGVAGFPWLLRRLETAALPSGYGGAGAVIRRAGTWLLQRLAPVKDLGIGPIAIALSLSLGFQLLDIAVTFAIGQALGLDLNMMVLFVAMPIVYLATVLPVSPGGLGVREAALVVVLSQFGIAAADAALLALAVFLNRVAVGCVGAVQHMAGGVRLSREMRTMRREDG